MDTLIPLYYYSIEQAAAGLRNKDFTSVELTKACLDHIAQRDGEINAFVRVETELALSQAQASDERRVAGKTLGILDGIPYNLKDVYATKDSPTTASSHMLEDWLAPYNATVYSRLCEAGAVLLGKTNTDEFTMGVSTETSYYGVTRNPWNVDRVSGGSSGGPAASMAAHFGIFSIGTDTGGSIRQPAAFCGVVGLRPTYGRISRFGELAMASSLDQAGPVTKTVRDAAILLEILAGGDPLDATSSPEPVGEYVAGIDQFLQNKKPLIGLKVGIAKEYFGSGLDPDVEKATREAINILEQLGAELVDVSLPSVEHALAAYYIIAPAEVASNMARYDGMHFGFSVEKDASEKKDARPLYDIYASSRAEGFGAEVKRRIMLGTHVLSSGYYDEYYTKAEKVRAVVAHEFSEIFKKVDILAAPVSVHTAFKIGDKINDPLAAYKEDLLTVPLNIAGIPGMSVPCGLVEGMPVGLQLMTDRFREDILLNVAAAYEGATVHHSICSPLFSRIT